LIWCLLFTPDGPDAIDPAVLANIGSGGATRGPDISAKRIQARDRFVMVPVRENEGLRISADGSKTAAVVYLLTPDTIARFDIEPGDWVGGIGIAGDEEVQRAQGAEVSARPTSPLDLGKAIIFPEKE
jgi:hypothetical protein